MARLFSGSALGLSYNTKAVKQPPKDVKDLTNAKYKNKIAIPDPSESGTALDLLSIKVNNEGDKAWDEYKKLKDNGMKQAGANKYTVSSISCNCELYDIRFRIIFFCF